MQGEGLCRGAQGKAGRCETTGGNDCIATHEIWSLADGIPNLTSPDAIGLGARKKNQRILLDLLLDTVKSNNLSVLRFSIYLHPPLPIDCLWCDNSSRLSWHILLPANRGAPLCQWAVSVLSKRTMLNPVC